jgi:mono/diheme cytochrome c family protein
MPLHHRLIAAAAALALSTAAGAASAAPSPGATVRGQALVERNCSVCHAVDRPGGSPNSAAPPLRNLFRYVKMDDLARALRQGLLAKHPAMPEFRFTAQETEDIMVYLRSIQEQAEAIADRVR